MTLGSETTCPGRAPAVAVDVAPTRAALGVEVRGVDLGDLDATTRVVEAWQE